MKSFGTALRNTSAPLLLLGMAMVSGCIGYTTSEQRALAPEPQTNVTFEAPATQPVRDYDQTAALYQNGDIGSDTTAFRYKSADNVHVLLIPIVESGIYIGNLVTSPYTAFEQREGIVSTGPQFAPTYTGVPPLPASQAQIQAMLPTHPSTQPSEMSIGTSANGEPVVVTTAAGLVPAADLSTTAFAVVGHVQFPGRYEVQDSLTLAQAIVAAGLVEKDGSKVTVKIERSGEEPSSALLSDILAGQTANPVLVAGDVVTITVNE